MISYEVVTRGGDNRDNISEFFDPLLVAKKGSGGLTQLYVEDINVSLLGIAGMEILCNELLFNAPNNPDDHDLIWSRNLLTMRSLQERISTLACGVLLRQDASKGSYFQQEARKHLWIAGQIRAFSHEQYQTNYDLLLKRLVDQGGTPTIDSSDYFLRAALRASIRCDVTAIVRQRAGTLGMDLSKVCYPEQEKAVESFDEILGQADRISVEGHDYRNPLAAMQMNNQLRARNSEIGKLDKVSDLLSMMYDSVAKLSTRLDYGYSRIVENAYARDEMSVDDLLATVTGAIRPFMTSMGKNEEDLIFKIEDCVLLTRRIVFSIEEAERFAQNIGTNIAKKVLRANVYEPNVWMELSTSGDQKKVELAFCDTMGGFDDGVLDENGEFKLGKTSWNGRKDNGHGIGLSNLGRMIKSIYSGSLRGENRDFGAAVVLSLPLMRTRN